MSRRSYSTEILISANPESVYKAITKDIDKWWTELSNQALQVGDQLIVRFEKTTSWEMTVSEAFPGQSLVWEVTEANHDLGDIKARDEWKGTTIKWKIVENETGSKVAFSHEGLMPVLECYEICEEGWGYFLGSLKDYLETGKGYPYKHEITE
ncbi:SRPBCC family protein [Vibrio algarum]|uniref:SRPBCC domain-containing protein n=1 Tax=Vibrio algarum TaxID=3020714 RepID=A0ABT4YQW1_9VIBR|nr:SRPBCC domain-containing protein [Vibrio sp. KJ40-1]MDB1123419.1 SRPBCC domain-containing protein [Vibrio sp. KJ40-1]